MAREKTKETIVIQDEKIIEYGFIDIEQKRIFLKPASIEPYANIEVNNPENEYIIGNIPVEKKDYDTYSSYTKVKHLNYILLVKNTDLLKARNLANRFITEYNLYFKFEPKEFGATEALIIDDLNKKYNLALTENNTIFNDYKTITINLIKIVYEETGKDIILIKSDIRIRNRWAEEPIKEFFENRKATTYLISYDVSDYYLDI